MQSRLFSWEVVHEETLKDNRRSCRNIVEFNNALFTTLPGVLQAAYNEALSVSSPELRNNELLFH
ncbi:MAG: hypothetical protein ACLRS8_04060 [Parabacteroides merdae]